MRVPVLQSAHVYRYYHTMVLRGLNNKIISRTTSMFQMKCHISRKMYDGQNRTAFRRSRMTVLIWYQMTFQFH